MNTAKEFLEKYPVDFMQALDQSGMGSVYTTEDPDTGQPLVLKSVELHPMFDHGEYKARYEAAMELSHPNLLPYKGVFRFPSSSSIQHYILMPMVELGDLAAALPNLSNRHRLDVLEGLLNALGYLHQQGFILQNLRAEHLLLKKVEDIYIPMLINYGAKAPLSLAFFVNYEYLAPEQLKEEAISVQTDVWALGVLMYQLFLDGKLPFGKKSPQSPNAKIKERILEGELPSLIEEVPQPYQELIRKSLQLKPEDRWSSIESMSNYMNKTPYSTQKTAQASVLDTLAYLGDAEEEASVEKQEATFFSRSFKRKPSKPINWLRAVLWLMLAALAGYFFRKYF